MKVSRIGITLIQWVCILIVVSLWLIGIKAVLEKDM